MITELYVPRPLLADFLAAAARDLRALEADVVYGTVRLIEPDDESFLAWAREPWACVVLNLHVEHTAAGIADASTAFRRLIDLALERGGSFYLTYHRWATARAAPRRVPAASRIHRGQARPRPGRPLPERLVPLALLDRGARRGGVIRSVTVLAAAFRGGGKPCVRIRIAGVDALRAEPRRGVGPVVVFANAATPNGIDEPAVGRLLGGLASAGFVAIAPELPCVRRGEVTPATIEALVDVASASGRRVALIGASTGAGLVILAAADPRLVERVTAVAAIAPFASLREILRLGTTGHYHDTPFDAVPLVATAAACSLRASAPYDAAVSALLANRDPERFDPLYAALAPSTRAVIEDLSPVARIPKVLVPVEILSSPDDPFFPVDESRALAAAGQDVRVTVTSALEHVRPSVRPGLIRVASALEQTLRRALEAEGRAPLMRPSPAQ